MTRPELAQVLSERWTLDEPDAGEPWCFVNARLLATGHVLCPSVGSAWVRGDRLLAATLAPADGAHVESDLFRDSEKLLDWIAAFESVEPPERLRLIRYPWDLVAANGEEIERQLSGAAAQEGELHDGAHLVNPSQVHIEPRAVIKPGAVLDASEGPVLIERGALIEPNAVIQGPAIVGAGSIVRPGAVVRGETTIGPVCKVGGEIEASIFQGFSNKQHDGFLGHSFVGMWVNLGADTITSDLKNTYGTIRVKLNGVGVETGRHFVGSTIGDHAKTGIGTILPTGCVIGVAANIFTQIAVPKFVPSFAWLTGDALEPYRLEKAISIARTVMGRRNQHLSDAERELLAFVAANARRVEAAGWE
ncbi:MAG: hypothetical protein D6744_04620 [Planctomycetota bacterium]|nr:MAG: hypothetical protein D6744_04620 [Planctomycetota bacterium]